jgi:hypothetical protein
VLVEEACASLTQSYLPNHIDRIGPPAPCTTGAGLVKTRLVNHIMTLSEVKARGFVGTIRDQSCMICLKGTDLVHCDYCPAAFHLECRGIASREDGVYCCEKCEPVGGGPGLRSCASAGFRGNIIDLNHGYL